MRLAPILLALAALSAATYAAATETDHPALLPAPQKVRYGAGSVRFCDLRIETLDKADYTAVEQLRDLHAGRCGQQASGKIRLELTQDELGGDLPGTDDKADPHGRESYTISVTETHATIHAHAGAGLFYGVQTLKQLIDGDRLPVVEIEDWPSLPYRGFMMDMSHGAVLTVAEVERQLDLLSRFKSNQYFFYAETSLRLDGYPLLQQPSDWTKADVATIVAYARERHIDVVPCVELYGHLHDLFRQERYSSLAALEHGGEANPANPDVQRLLADWLRQYAAMFPSPWFHLGFDEPFELEKAGSKAAGGVAPDTLWLKHLQGMARLASELGKRPLFWADIDEGAYIFNKYPGLAAGLPKGAIAAPWFYDARSSYDSLLDLFATNHVPILVASGISDWDNIAPDFESTFINIDGFLAAGKKANAIGLLNTEWSDSALALHREAEPAMAYGAVAAWQSQPTDRSKFFASYSRLLNSSAVADAIGTALTSIEKSQTALRNALGSETSFRMWDDPFQARTFERIRKNQNALHDARLHAEDAMAALVSTQDNVPTLADKESIATLLLAAKMLDYTGMKFIYAIEISNQFEALGPHPSAADVSFLRRETAARNHSRVGDLLDISAELEQQYRDEWLRQYKPFRLQSALVRWQAEELYWRHLQASILYLTLNFKQGDAKPTLHDVLDSK